MDSAQDVTNLFLAWVGDSEACLFFKDKNFKILTTPHNPSLPVSFFLKKINKIKLNLKTKIFLVRKKENRRPWRIYSRCKWTFKIEWFTCSHKIIRRYEI